MESDWIEYKCKSGQTFFLYNKATGEQKWPFVTNQGIEYRITYDPLITHKECTTIATQTDDFGCNNGCTSKYINARPSTITNTSNATPPQQQPGVSNVNHTTPSKNATPAVHSNVNRSTNDRRNDGIPQSVLAGHPNVNRSNSDSRNDGIPRSVSASHPNVNRSTSDSRNDGIPQSVSASHPNVNRSTSDSRNDGIPRGGDNQDKYQDPNEIIKLLNVLHETAMSLNTPDSYQEYAAMNERTQHNRRTIPQQHHQASTSRAVPNRSQSGDHSDKQTFHCTFCPKSFNHKGQFNRHVRVHTGEKPFECSICKKCFAGRDSLVKHTRVHTKEKPFECSHCEKTFSRKDHLNTHIKTHTGDKRFECALCDKKFVQKGNWRLHAKTHARKKT